MAVCESCIHSHVCKYGENRSNGMYCTGEKCKQYQSTADVVPRAEYDALDAECSRLERYESRWYDEVVKVRAEVARDIFADLEQYAICEELYMFGVCLTEEQFEELKKKYGVE